MSGIMAVGQNLSHLHKGFRARAQEAQKRGARDEIDLIALLFLLLHVDIGFASGYAVAFRKVFVRSQSLPPIAEAQRQIFPSSEQLYQQRCATCAPDVEDNGPAAALLSSPSRQSHYPRTLSQRSVPHDYVSRILLFGPGVTAHGSIDAPHGEMSAFKSQIGAPASPSKIMKRSAIRAICEIWRC